MKKSVIKDIFNGFRGHIETMRKPVYEDKNGDILIAVFDELKENLSPEQMKLHEKFVSALEKDFCGDIDFFLLKDLNWAC